MEKPTKIISVGDFVSNNLIKHDIIPQVLIIDNKIMRKAISTVPFTAQRTLYLNNPSGALNDEAWSIIFDATETNQQTKVIVNGEEDLLTLVAVECAPEGSFVIYGQPYTGLVVIRVTKQSKVFVHQIVEEMKQFSKA